MPETNNNIMGYFFNIISLIGMILATVATGLIIIFLSVELITGVESPYLGILVYFIFPAMLILGLFWCPSGAYRVGSSDAWHHRKRSRPIRIWT